MRESGPAAGDTTPRRLFVYSGGFLTSPRIRRILGLAGWSIRIGAPGPGDWVGVWGHSPTAPRGERVAGVAERPVLRVEDTFLRSVRTGREGDPPIGLSIDTRGVHFDSAHPSDLEVLLAEHPLDDTALLDRARQGMERLRRAELSKYNGFDPDAPLPASPYVLVVDQTQGDASVRYGAADASTFREMLARAQAENPGSTVVIKGHPESATGGRAGYFGPSDAAGNVLWLPDPVSPWRLLEGATSVYTVSSQLGFEAILAGHRPRVFGQPFYAGWGLTDDSSPVGRRQRRLTRAQLFAAAMLLYPVWYDPCRDRLCSFEDALDALEAEVRAYREDRHGWVALGMAPWKRRHLRAFFGDVRFTDRTRTARDLVDRGRRAMVWGTRAPSDWPGDAALVRVEDGPIRSRGLGADLVPPLCLSADDLGLHYDPGRESRLERLIAASVRLSDADLRRAERLVARLRASGLTKYNLDPGTLPPIPVGRRILVAGQVEDDASVLLGAMGEVRTNRALLEAARAANPGSVLLWKPHPDVEAGLRRGILLPADVDRLADAALTRVGADAALAASDEVWTMTSGIGFEALVRGLPVTCTGLPFYAGWGLTRDLAPLPRRRARPTLEGLVHATLIDWPRYRDPVSRRPCSVEVILDRLEAGEIPPPPHRVAARAQSLLARLGLRG